MGLRKTPGETMMAYQIEDLQMFTYEQTASTSKYAKHGHGSAHFLVAVARLCQRQGHHTRQLSQSCGRTTSKLVVST